MKNYIGILVLIITLFSCKTKVETSQANQLNEKPNIIYILADDLGYADLGAYGQDLIETPNIDALAKEGMLFTQHYSSAPVCAPARAMFLTGLHSGHSPIRGNDAAKYRGDVWNFRAVMVDSTLEGQAPMPGNTITFPKRMQEAGYKTAAVGKWGLGFPGSESTPNKMGFDYFYGYNCQRQAHTYYPKHLYENEARVYINDDAVVPHRNALPEGTDLYNEANYENYELPNYAPDLIFNKLTNFVDENKNNPFFLYWATPIPHVALAAPNKWVNYYHEKIGEEEPYNGKSYLPSRYPKATYAAMISYFDENVGKLIQQLKDEGIYENTLIIFTSDNGPSNAGGAETMYFDSAKPFSSKAGRAKGNVYEGGIRVPLIASWKNHIPAGTISSHPTVQYDFFATFADLLQLDAPEETDGLSFLPELLQNGKTQKHEFLYWEFPEYGGQLAIQMDNWKMVRRNLNNNQEPTLELYNLATDSLELTNVAAQHPEVIQRAKEILESEHQEPENKTFKMSKINNLNW